MFGIKTQRKKGLRYELKGLKKNYRSTEEYLREVAREFWANGGICCPGCGVRGYSALQMKQDRRYDRIRQIEKKLESIDGQQVAVTSGNGALHN